MVIAHPTNHHNSLGRAGGPAPRRHGYLHTHYWPTACCAVRPASRGTRRGPELARSRRALRCKQARAIREAQFARDNAVHTSHQPARPTRTACRQPDISACVPCVAVSTRERPAPVRAAGPRVAGARAPPRINVWLTQPHAESAHRSSAQRSQHMQRPARLLPLHEERFACLGMAPAPPILRTSLRIHEKSAGPSTSLRGRLRAPLVHTATHA